ncbi:MAG: ribosome recycling factor [Gammaproteobacteria bacterium]
MTIDTTKMEKTTASLRAALGKMRSGRARPEMLDGVIVRVYGAEMPLAQTATVSVSDSHTLLISPFDKQNTAAIEKAVRDADLGLNPAAQGDVVRVGVPPLSEERRRELVKIAAREGETARVAIRNIRRQMISDVKNSVKEKTIGEDEGKMQEQQIAKAVEDAIAGIDAIIAEKRLELMND